MAFIIELFDSVIKQVNEVKDYTVSTVLKAKTEFDYLVVIAAIGISVMIIFIIVLISIQVYKICKRKKILREKAMAKYLASFYSPSVWVSPSKSTSFIETIV